MNGTEENSLFSKIQNFLNTALFSFIVSFLMFINIFLSATETMISLSYCGSKMPVFAASVRDSMHILSSVIIILLALEVTAHGVLQGTSCLYDAWFVFDLAVVWIAVCLEIGSQDSILVPLIMILIFLRAFRMFRLLYKARVALVQAMNERIALLEESLRKYDGKEFV